MRETLKLIVVAALVLGLVVVMAHLGYVQGSSGSDVDDSWLYYLLMGS